MVFVVDLRLVGPGNPRALPRTYQGMASMKDRDIAACIKYLSERSSHAMPFLTGTERDISSDGPMDVGSYPVTVVLLASAACAIYCVNAIHTTLIF